MMSIFFSSSIVSFSYMNDFISPYRQAKKVSGANCGVIMGFDIINEEKEVYIP